MELNKPILERPKIEYYCNHPGGGCGYNKINTCDNPGTCPGNYKKEKQTGQPQKPAGGGK